MLLLKRRIPEIERHLKPLVEIPTGYPFGGEVVDLLHHQPMLREEDGVYVCSRCELVNPTNEVPCIPVESNPSSERLP